MKLGSATLVWLLLGLMPACASDSFSSIPEEEKEPSSPAPDPEPEPLVCPTAVGLDPAPTYEAFGQHSNAECTSVDLVSFSVDPTTASTFSVSGYAPGTAAGTYYVRGVSGEEVAGPIPVAGGSGAFDMTAPLFCGEQVVKLVFCNADCVYVAVIPVVGRPCAANNLQVTLSWDDLGRDWELHLIRQGGQINDGVNDCTWNTCVSSSLDWGVLGSSVDDPQKDIDDIDSHGPENIYLDNPAAGTYTIMVEHWSGSGSASSDGRAIINVDGVATTLDVTNLAPYEVWTVATVAWPSGVVTPVNNRYSCGGNWSNGCDAAIP
jgi:hypothetical protein